MVFHWPCDSLFLYGQQSYGNRAHPPRPHFNLITSVKAVSPKTVTFWATGGLGLQHMNLGMRTHNSAHKKALPRKLHTSWVHFYEISRQDKIMETESRSVVAWARCSRARQQKACGETFWSHGNVPYFSVMAVTPVYTFVKIRSSGQLNWWFYCTQIILQQRWSFKKKKKLCFLKIASMYGHYRTVYVCQNIELDTKKEDLYCV